jgi:hypothetical protein
MMEFALEIMSNVFARLGSLSIVTYILFQNFAVELQLENAGEFEMDHFLDQLTRAGGANYGTGVRDL